MRKIFVMIYYDAVLDTVSLIALEAYYFMCHSRAEYYVCCNVRLSTHYVFPTVSFVCQTSTVVGSTASRILSPLCLCGMLLLVTMHYVIMFDSRVVSIAINLSNSLKRLREFKSQFLLPNQDSIKASEYQVSVPPSKRFQARWKMEEAWLRCIGKSSRTSSKVLGMTPFYQRHRTIQDVIRSVRDVSAFTDIRCKDIILKMSEHNNLQRRARTFLADMRTLSPLNFWLI
jgi:hypothetical protein